MKRSFLTMTLSMGISWSSLSSLAFAQDEGSVPPTEETSSSTDETPLESPPTDAVRASEPNVDSTYNAVSDAASGIWSKLQLGPSVQLGLPHPLTYGVEGMYDSIVSFGFSTGNYSTSAIDKAEIEMKSWDVFARWHPFAGSFFLGGAYGHQSLTGTFKDNVNVVLNGVTTKAPAQVDIDISSNYFSPRLGWIAVWDSGLMLGFEFGVQIPMSPKSSVDANVVGMSAADTAAVKATEDYKNLKKDADDAAETLGEKTLPFLTLFKFGWLF